MNNTHKYGFRQPVDNGNGYGRFANTIDNYLVNNGTGLYDEFVSSSSHLRSKFVSSVTGGSMTSKTRKRRRLLTDGRNETSTMNCGKRNKQGIYEHIGVGAPTEQGDVRSGDVRTAEYTTYGKPMTAFRASKCRSAGSRYPGCRVKIDYQMKRKKKTLWVQKTATQRLRGGTNRPKRQPMQCELRLPPYYGDHRTRKNTGRRDGNWYLRWLARGSRSFLRLYCLRY